MESKDIRALIADEMGLGKTFQSLKVFQRNKSVCSPCLVICPSSLKWNWRDEALLHANIEADIAEGRKPSKRGFHSTNFLIINYEILNGWMDFILNMDPQLVIFDESHRIKNRSTATCKNVTKICKYSPHVLALSGTPLTKEPSELWTTLNILWPEKYRSFWSFAQRYTNAEHKPWGWVFSGGKNLPELHKALLELGMLRRKKSEVLSELPDKALSVIPVQIPKTRFKEYNKARDEFLEWLKEKSLTKAVRAKKALALVKIGYLLRLAAEMKMDFNKDWIDSFLQQSDEKLIVFGTHKEVLEPLFKRYKKKAVLITGKVTGKKRHQALEEFKKKPDVRISFCNYRSGGVGLNMQEASHVLPVELPWVPAELDQAISRAHRMGQKNAVSVHIPVVPGTIEEKLCAKLQDRQAVADELLDGGVDAADRLDIYDQIIGML